MAAHNWLPHFSLLIKKENKERVISLSPRRKFFHCVNPLFLRKPLLGISLSVVPPSYPPSQHSAVATSISASTCVVFFCFSSSSSFFSSSSPFLSSLLPSLSSPLLAIFPRSHLLLLLSLSLSLKSHPLFLPSLTAPRKTLFPRHTFSPPFFSLAPFVGPSWP